MTIENFEKIRWVIENALKSNDKRIDIYISPDCGISVTIEPIATLDTLFEEESDRSDISEEE